VRGGAGEPDVVGQGQQALLAAVVEIPLQPAAFGIGGFHDLGAGGAQFFELGEQLGLQPLVVQAEPDGRPDPGSIPGTAPECETAAMVRPFVLRCVTRTAGGGGGFGDCLAAGVDVMLLTGSQVGDLECRVAQGRSALLQGSGRGRLVEAGSLIRSSSRASMRGPHACVALRGPGGGGPDRAG